MSSSVTPTPGPTRFVAVLGRAVYRYKEDAMDQQIWSGILDADRYYRYYSKLALKFRKRQTWYDVVLGLPIAAMVGLLASQFLTGSSLALALTLLAAVMCSVGIWQWRQQFGARAAAAGLIATQYRVLGEDLRRLWHQGRDDEVYLAILTERLNSIGVQYDLPNDERLNQEAWNESSTTVRAEFS